jgi:hypothetical protein
MLLNKILILIIFINLQTYLPVDNSARILYMCKLSGLFPKSLKILHSIEEAISRLSKFNIKEHFHLVPRVLMKITYNENLVIIVLPVTGNHSCLNIRGYI